MYVGPLLCCREHYTKYIQITVLLNNGWFCNGCIAKLCLHKPSKNILFSSSPFFFKKSEFSVDVLVMFNNMMPS